MEINDADLNIGSIALTLAALARPDKEREPYWRHLERLTNDVTSYVAGYNHPLSLNLRHEALIKVIHQRYGYVGTEDCFDDIDVLLHAQK